MEGQNLETVFVVLTDPGNWWTRAMTFDTAKTTYIIHYFLRPTHTKNEGFRGLHLSPNLREYLQGLPYEI